MQVKALLTKYGYPSNEVENNLQKKKKRPPAKKVAIKNIRKDKVGHIVYLSINQLDKDANCLIELELLL